MRVKTIHFSKRYVVHLENGHILTIEDTKKILKAPNMSDDDATEIRDGFRRLVEVIYDKFMSERRKGVRENKTGFKKATTTKKTL